MIDKTIDIAKEAGEIIKRGFTSNISIEFKTDESNIVTDIDKASEKVITEFIKTEFPTHSIIAEESGSQKNSSEYTWVIDPLDGTTNFAHRLPLFAVSIGLQKENETILGVVYDVMRDVIYAAEKGGGAFENDVKINVSNTEQLSSSLLVTGFAYDRKDEYREAVQIFGNFLPRTRAVRRLGSAALDFCYVASGVFDGFWEANLSPWDVCAGMLLVEEAGGKVSNFDNNPINIFSDQFLASNCSIHKNMINIFKDVLDEK